MIKGISTSKSTTCTVIDIDEILKELDMTSDQFLDMCILLGCDYLPKVKNVGPVSAFNLIKSHKSLANFISD